MEYRPELLSRRGEYVAWGIALVAIAAWVILHLTDNPVFGGLTFLTVLLALSGIAISLGNWMDRRTILRLEPDGVWYDNGSAPGHAALERDPPGPGLPVRLG